MRTKWLALPGVAALLLALAGCGRVAGEVDATDDIIVRSVVEANYKANCKMRASMRASIESTTPPGMGVMPDACTTATLQSISLRGTVPRRAAKAVWNTPGGPSSSVTEYYYLDGDEFSFTSGASDESTYSNTK